MKTIPLTRGLFAQVDDEDHPYLSQFTWYADKSRNTFYAARNVPREGGGWKKTTCTEGFWEHHQGKRRTT